MNVNDVDMNGEASGSHTDQTNERLSNSPKHNDCSKHCGHVGGGARPKIRHIVCNIPNGIDRYSDDDDDAAAAKVNNNILHRETSEEADNKSDSNLGVPLNKVHNGLNMNHSNGHEPKVGMDSYLRNNVNFHSVVDKCPLKVRNCSDSADFCSNRFPASDSGCPKGKAGDIVGVGWRDTDSSSDTGNEGEDGLSADECCIYTYKGDQCADLPSSFFRLDALVIGDQPGAADGSRCRRDDGEERDHNSGSSSPEMDFLEMDFDPGPSCEQDSDEETDPEELGEEEAIAYPSGSPSDNVNEPSVEVENVAEGEPKNDLNAVASGSNNDVDNACAVSTPSSPEEPVPVAETFQPASLPTQRVAATCWPVRDAWGHHCNSGDLCSPGECSDVDGEVWIECSALMNAGNMKMQGDGLADTRKYNLHSALYHCIMAKRLVLDKQASFSESDECSAEGGPEDVKSPAERVMIWSELEACMKQVTQIATSACGATAVINVLLALNIPYSLERIKEGVATRLRLENVPLPEYLFSRSVAGATHVDIIRGLEFASEGGLYARFFHMYPARAISLTRWLAYWMKKGAIPIATLNLQHGLAPGCTIPDAWHHQMIFGVGPRNVYLTNPLERVSEDILWPQLCSPSDLLIRRNDVLSKWNEHTDLRPLMTQVDQRWKRKNVLGQVVNVIRESACSRVQGPGRVVTSHISIPASYRSGITLAISRESPAYDELKNASELPLLKEQ